MRQLWRRRREEIPHFFSHIAQDRWVAEVYQGRKGGYFLDFGAFDGVDMSNTLYLERELGWRGICVEANPSFFPRLCESRTAICINAALWPVSREQVQFADAHGLSSVIHLADKDSNAEQRARATRRIVEVDTINPTELLDRFEAPREIEYLSLDVEGAEYDIITSLDLSKYDIRLMTIEHDCSENRKRRLREYLAPFGYVGLQMAYDDFYFKMDGRYPITPPDVARRLGCHERGAT